MATWNPIFQDSRSTALVHTGAGRLFQPLSLVDHLKSGDCGWTIRSTTGYWLGLTSIKYPDLITEQQFRTIQGRRSRGNQRQHGHVCVCVCVTPWSTVFLQKLLSPQLLKKFPSHYRIQRFITVFTTARHLSIFWGEAITAILTLSAYSLKIHFNITLTPTPLSFRFTPTKTLYAFTSHHTFLMPRPSQTLWFDNQHRIWWGVSHYAVFSGLLLPPPSYARISSSAPSAMWTPQCARPNVTLMWNKQSNNSSIHFNLYILRQQRGRETKITKYYLQYFQRCNTQVFLCST